MFSKSIIRFAVFGVTALFVTSTACAIELGDSVPDIQLKLKDGKQLDLKEYRGKIVYLDFWASWCPPCRHSLPWISKLREQYSNDDLEIIAINLDTDMAAAEQVLSGIKQNFHIGLDPEGKTPSVFEPKAMPTSYLIDKTGKVTSIFEGFHESEKNEIEKEISKMLKS